MKQVLTIAIFALAAFPLAAEEAEVPRTWLVATTVPADLVFDARADLIELGDRSQTLRSRGITKFRHVNGFAVKLTASEARQLERSPLVRWVEPNLARKVSSSAPVVDSSLDSPAQIIPYGIAMVGAPESWKGSRGRNVKVGVIDTGIDRGHPDLAERYRGGYDFVNGDDDPQDDNGHGTHVAGTIAAVDNELGVVGVAPEADLYALKVLDDTGSGSVYTLISAIEWAIDNDLDVVNMSLGSPQESALEKEVFERAEAAGIICVAASGNAGISKLDYPANYPTVVSVGAVDLAESIASFSQRGANLDFVAPGVGVDSTIFHSFYGISTSDGKVLAAERMHYSPSGNVTGTLVDCGSGFKGQCPPETTGNIALIRRGETTFADKVTTAKSAGAIAVVIYNHYLDTDPEGGVVLGTLGVPGPWPLTVGTSNSSGEHLRSLVDKTVTVSLNTRSDYGRKNGTSMATPHVAGAIAVLLGMAPAATSFEILESLRLTARDLGPAGWDSSYGNGRIDVNQAARRLAPAAFEEPGQSRRRAARHPEAAD
ncbi:MAG: S8 family serine peptidase [Acidobacteria bacterium]|nr:S8 family serine peptidase [Acidobacteriota bacterium]